jgi:hypothetical protein
MSSIDFRVFDSCQQINLGRCSFCSRSLFNSDAGENDLSGSIPTVVSLSVISLYDKTVLSRFFIHMFWRSEADGNRLTGILPTELGLLTSLTNLYASKMRCLLVHSLTSGAWQ